MADPMFGKVAFIGIGLIGSSMARRMAKDGLAEEFVACARSKDNPRQSDRTGPGVNGCCRSCRSGG